MEKTNGYYVAKYLKNNALVLVCELVVVLLLSLICSIIMEADPMWLPPVIAVVTYLIAEVRFMMAYVATNARHEHDIAVAKGEIVEDELAKQGADEQEESTSEDAFSAADAALFVAAATAVEQNEQSEAQTEDDDAEQQEVEAEQEDPIEDDEQDDIVEDDADAEVSEQDEPAASDDFSREVRLQLDKFLSTPKDQPTEQEEQAYDEQVADDEEEAAEPVFDELPPRVSLEIDDEDEAMDALFGAPVVEKDDIVRESLEIEDDDLDDMTMDDDDFARDVLEIGEVMPATDNEEQ